MPTVSVIIPTYNRSHLIGRSLQSVLNQSYHDFEVIIVDDASSDNTEEVVRKFTDKRIRYVRHEKNKGGAAARNTGIKISKGKYIAFQDSDDEWLEDKLEKQMKVFESASKEVGVVYTGFWRIENKKRIYIPSSSIKQKSGNIHQILMRGNFVTTQVAVVKKECFKKAGMFDEKLPRFQDWELWLRISKYYSFLCIDEPLVIAYYQKESISSNQIALKQALELILKKHYEDIKKDKKALAQFFYDYGCCLAHEGNIYLGRRYFFNSILANPLNTKTLISFIVSLFGLSIFNGVRAIYKKVKC